LNVLSDHIKQLWQHRTLRYFLLALAVILIDQASKLYVKLNFDLSESVTVIPDFFLIYFIENKGAAFGLTVSSLFGGISPTVGKLILTIFSLVLVGFIGWFLVRVAHFRTALPLFIALILGGAIGNIIDRLFYGLWFAEINNYEGGLFFGRVVDMFYFDIWQGVLPPSWPLIGGQALFIFPVFNVADAAISIGIIAVLLFQHKLFPQEETDASPTQSSATSATGATGDPDEPSPDSNSTSQPPPSAPSPTSSRSAQ
jgi:signal peptidase II